MKVHTLLGDFSDPCGQSGMEIDFEIANKIANSMRLLLWADLPEHIIAKGVQVFTDDVDQEELIAAWELLNAGERAAWKRYCQYDMWLMLEKLRARD